MAKAAAATVIWSLLLLQTAPLSGQKLPSYSSNSSGICHSVACNTLRGLSKLSDCEVILGNLRLVLLERTVKEHFKNISFPKLREVTGFMVVYRVIGLHTLGTMFPNLARIRGRELIYNFALVVYDMPSLEEVGLHSLVKVDRGGVIIWGGYEVETCYVKTVNWDYIAPQSHLQLTVPEGRLVGCHSKDNCHCSTNPQRNYCWNNRTCQRFIEGPEAEKCNEQCLGCTKEDPNLCSLCRHYTYRGSCVSQCPDDTFILRDNKYCLTIDECRTLNGWSWNKTCVFDCPTGYERQERNGTAFCQLCPDCKKICNSKMIHTLSAIQHTEKCTLINGSLTIHTRSIPQSVEELRRYLNTIEEVTDYIFIYSSASITALDFLPSLKRIGGIALYDGKYSLVIRNMINLQNLFLPSVTRNLKIGRGKFLVHGNPLLCMNEIEELDARFPLKPDESDIPIGLNGYSGNCSEASQILGINITNESSATVFFSPISKSKVENSSSLVEYTVLYVRLPLGSQKLYLPETCSEAQWQAAYADSSTEKLGMIELKQLQPASTYAVCIETFDPEHARLARSSFKRFTTPFDRPEPPFIWEINATSHHEVVLRWVDHKHFYKLITRYELDVILIEIPKEHQTVSNHCEYPDDGYEDFESSRHGVLIKPPQDYFRRCDSRCNLFSNLAGDNIYEDFFDVCTSADHKMNAHETSPPGNSSIGKYVRTLSLVINAPKDVFKVNGLAPFRDYKFRLRACAKDKCSISDRHVVRTLRIPTGDIPIITHYEANNTGHISVKWKPPDATNGPLLAYSVQVQIPATVHNKTKIVFVDAFCVSPHELSTAISLQVAQKYLVRVCATTLGSYSACGSWHDIWLEEREKEREEMAYSWLWAGIPVSIIALFISMGISYFWRRRKSENDGIPLVDISSMDRNESEPPGQSASGMWDVSLLDSDDDYD